jgi:hypothetical protein
LPGAAILAARKRWPDAGPGDEYMYWHTSIGIPEIPLWYCGHLPACIYIGRTRTRRKPRMYLTEFGERLNAQHEAEMS